MAFWNEWIKDGVRKELESLSKGDPDEVPEKTDTMPLDDNPEIGRKAIVTDPFFTQQSQQTIFTYRLSRLSNKTLKDVSMRDWLVSSIVQNRVDTLSRFARPQTKKFDMGYRIIKKDHTEEYSEAEKKEIENLEEFIYNCGRIQNTPDDDRLLFNDFIKMIIRDALTFGNVTVEKVRTRRGALHRFRPVPAESIYHINPNAPKAQVQNHIDSVKNTIAPKSDNDPRKNYKVSDLPLDYYKYIQVSYDNRPLAVFGDEDLIFKLYNPQNFADGNGYCYSPVEMAVINITNHMNTEHYNSNFFTHGQSAKGVLHLKGTVTQSQMTAFRRQFYSLINGAQNAWRTPIVSGLEDVQWVPMAGGSKDMEYLNYNMHLMRAVCTQFQIDPMELGLDLLVTGGRAANLQGHQTKIEFSREKGLYPLLMFIEDFINSNIMPSIDSEYSKKYKFQFEGYTDETPQTEVSLLQAEMSVNKSMNDLLAAARKKHIKHPVADLTMNQGFWGLVEKNMTRGEIREIFFNDKGASKKKELQYIPGDPAFLQWQQLLMQIEQNKQQLVSQQQQADAQQQQAGAQQEQMQAQQQVEAQEKQKKQEIDDAKHKREQEKHEAEMNQLRGQAAHNAVNYSKK
jgi:hypothetical protein